MKMKIWDYLIRQQFWRIFSIYSAIVSFILLLNLIPNSLKEYFNDTWIGKNEWILNSFIILVVPTIILIFIWLRCNFLTKIKIKIDGAEVLIKKGDIFTEKGLKVIPFNEYFDVTVDNKIISERSLNGLYINNYLDITPEELSLYIKETIDEEDIVETEVVRKNKNGNTIKYRLSTGVEYKNYMLVAFSRFDQNDRAYIIMTDYIDFLINLWDRLNRVYAQRDVFVPIIGAGITRIKEYQNISEEDLLKIMLWTFKLSEHKFKHPARLIIVIHESVVDRVNFFAMKYISKEL